MAGYLVYPLILAVLLCGQRVESSELPAGAADACLIHTNITNWWRSSTYENDDYEHYDLCDRDTDEGWYRAVTGAGGDMPRSPPGFNRCGTVYPIWLDGDYPTNGDIVETTACVTGLFSDCAVKHTIFIKNCGDYNVYFLKQPYACPEAYCFGNETKCPPGWNSETGFTPGCVGRDPPILTQKPTLTYKVEQLPVLPEGVEMDQIVFQCYFSEPGIDPTVLYDVTFLMAGQVAIKVENMEEGDFPAELKETDFAKFQDDDHQPNLGYGSNLTCRVQAKWNATLGASRGVEVSEHYGFEVLTDMPITIKEGEVKTIEIRSRLPVNCPNIEPDCTIDVVLHVPKYHEDFKKCKADDLRSLLVLTKTSCVISLTSATWDTPNAITVKAETDKVYNKPPRSMVAKFYSMQQIQQPTLSNLELPPVLVTITEHTLIKNLQCSAVCDPHMKLYNGAAWDLMNCTEYILYVNKMIDTEVQVRFERCGGSATCICAVMVRAGRSLFIIDTCGDRHQVGPVQGEPLPPRSKLYDCDEGRNNLIVEQSGKRYTFTLPSKTTVIVDFRAYYDYHNLYLTPAVEDYEHAVGICGHIGKDGKVTLKLRNGNVATSYTQFAKDWIPTDDERMWGGKSTAPDEPVYYCGCSERDVVCEATDEHERCVDKIFNDREFAACREKKEDQRLSKLTGRKPRSFSAVDDDDDIEYDFKDEDFEFEDPEWKNGWTLVTATAFCRDYILSRDSIRACDGVPDVDVNGAIETCVLDIKITGDTEYSSSHMETIKHSCLAVASRNLSMWQQNGDGNGPVEPPADIIEANCPMDCNDRGICENGTCICHEGFSDVDCGVNDTAVPDIYRLPYKGICDLQDWSCDATMVYGRDMADSQNLTCKMLHYQVTADGLTETHSTELGGYMRRPGAAVCELGSFHHIMATLAEHSEILGFAYDIRLSNDGENYGNKLTMLAYDRKCADCTNQNYGDIDCVARDYICKIEGSCYDDGDDQGPSQRCMKCRVDINQNDWTQEPNTCFIDNLCYNPGESFGGQSCLVCDPQSSVSEWTLKDDSCFINSTCFNTTDENPSGPSCMVCDSGRSTDDWVPKDATCLIDDVCYDDNEENPEGYNCLICDSAKSAGNWTVKDATCLIEDVCYDDGAENPGEHSCLICDSTTSPSDWTLKESTCLIEEVCYNDGEDNPEGNNCLVCDSTASTDDWTMKDNICQIEGSCYEDGEDQGAGQWCMKCKVDISQNDWTQEANTCLIDNLCYNPGENLAGQSCLVCDPQSSISDWTLKDATCLIDDVCYDDNEENPEGYNCLICDSSKSAGNWTVKDATCLIEDVCYDDGAENPGEHSCLICDSTTSPSDWTLKESTCLIEEVCYNDGEDNPDGKNCLVCDSTTSTDDWTMKDNICQIEGSCYEDGEDQGAGQWCMKCKVDISQNDWTQEPNTCFIDNLCYNPGENRDGQSCLVCDPQSSISDWTLKESTCLIEEVCYNDGEDNPDGKNCLVCDSTTSTGDWTMKDEVCHIDSQCYADEEAHPTENCVMCDLDTSDTDWTITDDNSCFIDDKCFKNFDPHPSESCVHCVVARSAYEWTVTASRMCFIDGRCRDDTEQHPQKECLVCVPQQNPTEWTITGCLIDDTCWENGEVNPDNTCELCSPDDSHTEWTPLEGCGVMLVHPGVVVHGGADGTGAGRMYITSLILALILHAALGWN